MHARAEVSKYLSCGWTCEIQERFTATVDKVHTDLTSQSGNTYTLANAFKLSLKHMRTQTAHTQTARRENHRSCGAEGSWQKRAPRGTNNDSSVTAHPLPYLQKTQILQYTQTNTYALQTNAHISFVWLSEMRHKPSLQLIVVQSSRRKPWSSTGKSMWHVSMCRLLWEEGKCLSQCICWGIYTQKSTCAWAWV